jgi:hypothetical protein
MVPMPPLAFIRLVHVHVLDLLHVVVGAAVTPVPCSSGNGSSHSSGNINDVADG